MAKHGRAAPFGGITEEGWVEGSKRREGIEGKREGRLRVGRKIHK